MYVYFLIRFVYLIWSWGLLCNPSNTWIGFYKAYDIGYIINVVTGIDLPDSMETFLNLIRCYFEFRIDDIKHLQVVWRSTSPRCEITRIWTMYNFCYSSCVLLIKVSVREPGMQSLLLLYFYFYFYFCIFTIWILS